MEDKWTLSVGRCWIIPELIIDFPPAPLISSFASQGWLNFYKKCHKADKHFQMMGKRCAGNYLDSCRAQELWWEAWNIWSCVLHTKGRDRLFPACSQSSRTWGRGAAKETRREHSSGVSSSQKLHLQCGKARFKQGMAQRRMAHPMGGPFQMCQAEWAQLHPWLKRGHCPDSMREG